MIFAVDFDGTLVEHAYPEIGATKPEVLEFVREIKRQGHKMILHTCRGQARTEQAVQWCRDNGIEPDAVNDDIPEIKETKFGQNKSTKPFADFYLDDRAMTLGSIHEQFNVSQQLRKTRMALEAAIEVLESRKISCNKLKEVL